MIYEQIKRKDREKEKVFAVLINVEGLVKNLKLRLVDGQYMGHYCRPTTYCH